MKCEGDGKELKKEEPPSFWILGTRSFEHLP